MSLPPASQPGQPVPGVGEQQQRMVAVRLPDRRPLVTYAILGITILVYILQELNHNGIAREPFLALARAILGPKDLAAFLANGWGNDLPVLLGGRISEYIRAGQVWRLLTPALLHGSLQHIGANMISLFIIGQRMERFYGHGRFLALYILSAIGGNLLSFLLTPGVSLGASTAVFGLLAAEGMFAFQNRLLFGQQARMMLNNVVFLLVLNLGIGITERTVDNWGHLGGLLVGLAFSGLAGPVYKVLAAPPEYVAVDQRSPGAVALAGTLVFFFLAGVTLFFTLFP